MDVTRVADLTADRRSQIFERDAPRTDIEAEVDEIIDAVRTRGDNALQDFATQFDDVDQDQIEITPTAQHAYESVQPEVREAIEAAATNIREFHQQQRREDWRTTDQGRTVGRRFNPIDRVGVYVPGGTAAYPSSALMGIIPAVVAGVEEIAVTTPPASTPEPATLAAIHAAGANEVYAAGGAQAVAALAYGTETIDRVRKVVGPGNRWVTAAKAAIRNDVAIDFLAGPSEILIIADDTATPAHVAADLLAQAEHDPHSAVVAVTPSTAVATAICDAIGEQLQHRDRQTVITNALASPASGVFLTADMDEATRFAQSYAPEHLSIQTTDPEELIDQIPSAGSVFLGHTTPVAAGDYATGTNHILPTGGGAHQYSGLSVDTFLRATTVQHLDENGLADLRETITTLATVEGLEGHAASVEHRFEDC